MYLTFRSRNWTVERDIGSSFNIFSEPPQVRESGLAVSLSSRENCQSLFPPSCHCEQKHSSWSGDAATFRHLIANFPLVSFELRQKVLCVECRPTPAASKSIGRRRTRPTHVFNLSVFQTLSYLPYTGMGERVVPRLCELATRGQRESGGGIHAT